MGAYRYRLPRKCRYRPHGRSNAGPVIGVAVAAALIAGTGAKAAAHHAARPSASAGSVTVAAITRAKAAQATAFARDQLGKPYQWGGTGPDAFDCSGLAMQAYASAGVTLERTSQEQWASEKQVPAARAQAGDLVFFAGSDGTAAAPGHVGIVVDPARHLMIDAYATGWPVEYDTYGLAGSKEGLGDPVGFTDPAPAPPAISWAASLLTAGGWPQASCNLAAIRAWEHAEGSNPAWRNPLDTTQGEAGSTAVNSDGVQAYPSWRAGLDATVTTLRSGRYGPVLSALSAGNSAQAVASAVTESPWGTRRFEVSC